MKIRNGFVSNSSSSSYLILITKDDYDKMLGDLTDLEKMVLKELPSSSVKAFGMSMKTIEWTSGNYDTFEDMSFSKFKSAIPKKTKKEEKSKSGVHATCGNSDTNYESLEEEDDICDLVYEARGAIEEKAKKHGAFIHSTDS